MKLNIKNKKIIGILLLLEVIIIAIIVGSIVVIYFYGGKDDEKLFNNAYIDIWKDLSMYPDITLFASGSGLNKKRYLGRQTTHYLINKNGDIYQYTPSAYRNMVTGKRDPAIVNYIKRISQSDLQKLEGELKLIIENYSTNDMSSDCWYIKIDGNTVKVTENVENKVLNNYLVK